VTVVLTSFKCPPNNFENQLIMILIHEKLVLVSKYGLQVYCFFKAYLIFFVHRRHGTRPWAFFQWGFVFKTTFRVLAMESCFHTMVWCNIRSTTKHIMIIAYLANNIPPVLVLSFFLHLQLGHGFRLETFLELSIWVFLVPNVCVHPLNLGARSIVVILAPLWLFGLWPFWCGCMGSFLVIIVMVSFPPPLWWCNSS